MNSSDFKPYVNRIDRATQLRRLVWEFVWLVLFRTTPRWALAGWRVFLLRFFGATIGQGCRIDPTCRVWAPWNMRLGTLTSVGAGVDFYCMAPITLGSKVSISQRAFLCAGSHEIETLARELITKPITIGDHAWVAAEAFVHPGVTIGDGAVIGARSVVTKDMPAWTVCAGHPCKPLKPRELKG